MRIWDVTAQVIRTCRIWRVCLSASSSLTGWNRQFQEFSGPNAIQCRLHPGHVLFQYRPQVGGQNQNRYLPAFQILLIPHILVGREKHVELLPGQREEFSILRACPPMSWAVRSVWPRIRLSNGLGTHSSTSTFTGEPSRW